MTDVRETSCSIVLGPEFDGRFYVRNAKRVLVAELYKPAGRSVELGLEPGTYSIHYEREPQLLDSSVTLVEGDRKTLAESTFKVVKRTATQKRGGEAAVEEKSTGLFMDGRTRVELFGGFTDSFVHVDSASTSVEVGGGQGGMGFVHWIREDVALELQGMATDISVVTTATAPTWGTSETNGSFGVLFGARYYFPKQTFGAAFRPYVTGAMGPFSEYYVYSGWNRTEVKSDNTRFGGQIGGGVDFQLSRLFSLDVKAALTLRQGYDPSFGMNFGFGFAWGKGRHRD